MSIYAIFDTITGYCMGTYTADAPNLDAVSSTDRDLVHARLTPDTDPNQCMIQEIDGELCAIPHPDYVPPPPVVPDMVAITEAIITEAIQFGISTVIKFSAENVRLGITQAGKTAEVRGALSDVVNCLQTGSLYDAIQALRAVPEEKKDAVFITDLRLLAAINRIETYLNRPLSTSL